jgi:hypothetical protein
VTGGRLYWFQLYSLLVENFDSEIVNLDALTYAEFGKFKDVDRISLLTIKGDITDSNVVAQPARGQSRCTFCC